MAQRQSILTFDSTSVQGEGSWIKVRMITHGEGKMFQRQFADIADAGDSKAVTRERREEFNAASEDLLVKQIVAWNWVDDDGNALPIPKDDPSVIDLLTELEHQFIGEAIQGKGERKK